MKVILFGDNKDKIAETVRANGFEIVEEDPDYVISFGGDGTLMRSEGAYPGIPKIALRDSKLCKTCSKLPNEEVLKRVRDGSFKIERLMKLQAEAKGIKLCATNDVTVHNKDPRHGIRYTLTINGEAPLFNHEPFNDEIIGDGIVVATPFGSTGYYRSITDSFFELGIGLAFNNSTEQADHMVLKDDSVIELTVTRGPAEVYADNNEEAIELSVGEKVSIRKSDLFGQIIRPL